MLAFKSTGKSIALGEFAGPKAKGDAIYLITVLDLKGIVTKSLENSKLFSAVETESQTNADYTLTASMMGQQSDGVLTITMALIVKYEITRNTTGEVVFSKTIFGRKSVSTSDEFAGVNRARMAVEGAARDNVKKLLEEISKVQL